MYHPGLSMEGWKMSKLFFFATLLAFGLFSFPAHSRPYIGLGLSRVSSSVPSAGSGTYDANGVYAYVGNRLNEFGFEFGYLDVGKVDMVPTTTVITGNLLKIQMSYFVDLSGEFQLVGKFGLVVPHLQTNTGGWNYNMIRPAWSVGMNYNFSERTAGRVEYEQHKFDPLEMNMLTFSINMAY